jgi:hypothetical protein
MVKTARLLFPIAAALAVSVVMHARSQSPASAAAYFPGESWRTATPESQGIDSQAS